MINCENNFERCLIKSIFDDLNIYSVLVEKDGTILYSSKKFKEYYPNTNTIGMKISDFVNKNTYEELRKMMLEVIFTNKTTERDIIFQDGDFYKVDLFPITNKESQVTHLLIGAVNVSKIKKIENENIELKRKLEESNSIKSIFLSNISHELRTPMNAIIGFSDLLLSNKNKDQNERFLKSINSNGKYLDELLNNILDYSKIESNEFDILYENFSLNELLDELKDIFEDVNYKKNLDIVELIFTKGEDKKIISDYLRLKQVLFNVISNAIKFTEKGYIKISYSDDKEFITFKIQDTGVGIPQNKLKFIFDRFWQADSSSTKKHKGAGLGLAISKSIVEMLNGEISVESKLGAGTTFYIKIPLEEIKETIIIKNNERLNFSGKTVLIIDDLPINYSLLGIYLNSLNVNILSDNGKDAIKIYKKQKEKIELIFLDLSLSNIDSFELAKKLKQINKDCFIISKSGTEEIPKENINFHFKKPINKDNLVIVLNKLWQK